MRRPGLPYAARSVVQPGTRFARVPHLRVAPKAFRSFTGFAGRTLYHSCSRERGGDENKKRGIRGWRWTRNVLPPYTAAAVATGTLIPPKRGEKPFSSPRSLLKPLQQQREIFQVSCRLFRLYPQIQTFRGSALSVEVVPKKL